VRLHDPIHALARDAQHPRYFFDPDELLRHEADRTLTTSKTLWMR